MHGFPVSLNSVNSVLPNFLVFSDLLRKNGILGQLLCVSLNIFFYAWIICIFLLTICSLFICLLYCWITYWFLVAFYIVWKWFFYYLIQILPPLDFVSFFPAENLIFVVKLNYFMTWVLYHPSWYCFCLPFLLSLGLSCALLFQNLCHR